MFVTAYNYHTVDPEVVQEAVSDEVVVEPAESYTVRELVYRIAMGMPVSGGSSAGDYPDEDADFDDDLPTDRGDFDLSDYSQMRDELSQKYETVTRKKKVDISPAGDNLPDDTPVQDVSTSSES